MPRTFPVRLTVRQLGLLTSALDSHIYWELSDEYYRHSGYVFDPGSDDPKVRKEIRESERLLSVLECLALGICAASPAKRAKDGARKSPTARRTTAKPAARKQH
ncbi:hypothetical protein [Anaeromyxobacter diazotrophicus]|uniref:Uncharacterized protein n=1 Tax=Anaeromyxobacter diazotrophicus TaxID=2590199 RepID=A0A7I9VRQ1_9BACT|nr:hypothetical protein [Anaeromyxobacter diazotrophicus]GEJ59103.1 hypothetical protein AMYX_38440 [Anaeromyxobacter diazotrophicus]